MTTSRCCTQVTDLSRSHEWACENVLFHQCNDEWSQLCTAGDAESSVSCTSYPLELLDTTFVLCWGTHLVQSLWLPAAWLTMVAMCLLCP